MTSPTIPLVLVGKITAPHGLKGDVKIASHLEIPEEIARHGVLYTKNQQPFGSIKTIQYIGKGLVACFDSLPDRTAAEKVAGTELYLPRSILPETDENEFLYSDLIGLDAVDETGTTHGNIHAVHNFGAGDVLEITLQDTTSTVFYPFTKESVGEIDLISKTLRLDKQLLSILTPQTPKK